MSERNPPKVTAQARIQKFIEKPLAMLLKQLTGLGIDEHVTTIEAQVLALQGVIDALPEDVKKQKTEREPALPPSVTNPPTPGNGAGMVDVRETLGEPIVESFLSEPPTHAVPSTPAFDIVAGGIYETNAGAQVRLDGTAPEDPSKLACRYMDELGAVHSITVEPHQLTRRLQ